MSKKKSQNLEAELEMIEKNLANAQEYVAKNVNVEGSSFLHFGDWQGKSGHPSWMKNFMIPATMRGRARKERALRTIERKAKDKNLTICKRDGDC